MQKFFTILLLLFVSILAYSQKAAIKGTIIDKKTGETLPAVNVVLLGTTQGTISDFEGNYYLNNIEPGIYTVKFVFISYESKEIQNVELKAGEIKTFDVELGEAVLELDAVTVSAKKIERTETALVAMQRKSAVIISGISSQEMIKTGASSAAGALKKVTGVSVQNGKYVYVRGLSDRYSKTILNGADIPGLDPERNTVQMDLFPTAILDNMLVFKSFSPNLPADFTGGLINIKTKDFPEKYSLSFSVQVGYNPQANFINNFLTYSGGNYDFLGIDDGTRNLPDKAKGDIPARYEDNQKLNDITKSFNKIWFPQEKTSGLNQKYSLSIGNQKQLFGKTAGFFAAGSYSFDYKFFDDGFYGRYKLTDKNAEGLNSEYESQQWSFGQNNSLWALIGGVGVKLSDTDNIGLTVINNHSGQKNSNFSHFIDYRDNNDLRQRRTLEFTARNLFVTQIKGKHQLSGFNNIKINWIGSVSLASQNEPDIRYLVNDIDIENGDTLYYVNKSMYPYPRRFYRDMKEQNYFGKIDFELPLTLFNDKAKVMAGIADTYKNRDYYQTQMSFAENKMNRYGNMADYFADDNIDAITGIYVQASEKDDKKNSYNGTQNVFAAYAMADMHPANKLRAIFGLRVEYVDMQTKNMLSVNSSTGTLNKLNFLPSLNITYSPNDFMNLRAGYSRTLARPSFREKSIMAVENQVGDIIIGNDSLKQTEIDNIDFRWEKYFNHGEVISFGGFFKKFHNPIERSFNTEAINPEITWRNVDKAEMYGVEAEFTKKTDFISWLRNIKLSANITYVYSRVSIDDKELESKRYFDPDYPATRIMFEQSPWIVNAILSYKSDNTGLSVNLSYTYNAGKLVIVNPTGIPDIYSEPVNNLIFNITKKLSDKFAMRFQIKNILNTRKTYYYEYNNRTYNYLDMGLGRDYSIKLSYKF
jgi:outer membrane receptor protein involved in Fe transport